MFEVKAAEAGVEWTGKWLTARDQGSPASPPISVIFFSFFSRLLLHMRLDDLLHVSDLDQHVLRFQVCVDDSAFPVQVVQPQQYLLCDLLDQRHGNATVIPSLDEPQEILAQDFEHHTHMDSIRSLVFEGI